MTVPAPFAGCPGLAQAVFGRAAETGGHALRRALDAMGPDRMPGL
jgi:hypothetical protein